MNISHPSFVCSSSSYYQPKTTSCLSSFFLSIKAFSKSPNNQWIIWYYTPETTKERFHPRGWKRFVKNVLPSWKYYKNALVSCLTSFQMHALYFVMGRKQLMKIVVMKMIMVMVKIMVKATTKMMILLSGFFQPFPITGTSTKSCKELMLTVTSQVLLISRVQL